MNLSVTTVASFSIGLFCGYLLRKNWYLIKAVVFGKNNTSTRNKPKFNEDKNNQNSKDLPIIDESEDNIQSNVSIMLKTCK